MGCITSITSIDQTFLDNIESCLKCVKFEVSKVTRVNVSLMTDGGIPTFIANTLPIITESRRLLHKFSIRNKKNDSTYLLSQMNELCFALHEFFKILTILNNFIPIDK